MRGHAIEDFLALTDWDVFSDSYNNIDEYTDIITSYISFCQDVCLPYKPVKMYVNNKPWFNKEIKAKLKAKINNFREGRSSKQAEYELRVSIKRAKREYSTKLHNKFLSNDTRSMWQGLQNITGYKQKFHQSTPVNNVNITADGLNEFYARFDRQNKTKPTTNHNICFDCPFNIEEHQVISLFKKQNIHKAAGPDGIMTKTLKYCAKQLAPVFTDIFNNSLFLQHVPLCFKMSTIIPIQKKIR